MILQALTAYYEALAEKGCISRPGWSAAKISHALELDADGCLLAILPLTTPDEKGKKMLPRQMELPAPVKRTVGIDPNFLWDNAAYLLGFDGKGNPERAKKCFEAAKEHHLKLLSGLDDPFARAICAFFEGWDLDAAWEHPIVSSLAEELEKGGNLVFMFGGKYPYQNPALAQAWQTYYDSSGEGAHMRCLVTGERVMPESTHPAVKNVRGAQSSGAAIVSFNAPAFCSYNREQNLNAPVGKYAAFAYTTALNSLLADREHMTWIGDTTVVFWAESAEAQYQDAFAAFMDGKDENTVGDHDLKMVMDKLASGIAINWNDLPVKPDNRFYVLGLAPNAARLAVRFFLRDSFGDIARHLKEHYDRLEIMKPAYEKSASLPLWSLLRETVNPNARDKAASPQMAGDTLRAMLTGGRYPSTLYQAIQLRIRTDRNINYRRAAMIKAYLIRNTNDESYKEALTVELNEKTTYQPYILGRMFSVLESIQEKANPGINATIKDKYLSSACATPSIVFPTLLNLAEKHLRKMETGYRIYYAKQLGELTALVTESYANHHSLYDQGIFQLGYYHQTQKRYEKKNKTEKENTDNE